jgi:hypothetical protein
MTGAFFWCENFSCYSTIAAGLCTPLTLLYIVFPLVLLHKEKQNKKYLTLSVNPYTYIWLSKKAQFRRWWYNTNAL